MTLIPVYVLYTSGRNIVNYFFLTPDFINKVVNFYVFHIFKGITAK